MRDLKDSTTAISIPVLISIACASITLIIYYYLVDLKSISLLSMIALSASIIAVLATFFGLRLTRNINKKEVKMYNIAIIGLPQSGKTTFITSMYGAVMHGKIKLNGYNAIIKGNSTIDKINQNLSLLDRGIPIGATTDQTLFAYRVNIEEKSSHILRLRKEYQIEIGDFQGDDSRSLIDIETKIWKHDSEFFNWVKDANAFVFVVDLGHYFRIKNTYVAEISKSFRSAWQKIVELNDNQLSMITKQPVLLIFNKVDILFSVSKQSSLSEFDFNKFINEMAFSKVKLPEINYSDIDESMTKEIIADFDNLITFFQSNCKNFSFNFYSSFLADKYEYRKGLSDICNHIFPVYVRRTPIPSKHS